MVGRCCMKRSGKVCHQFDQTSFPSSLTLHSSFHTCHVDPIVATSSLPHRHHDHRPPASPRAEQLSDRQRSASSGTTQALQYRTNPQRTVDPGFAPVEAAEDDDHDVV